MTIRLARESDGAAAVEFLIAFMPLAMMFFIFLEFMRMALASTALQYAAFVGVRAAAVMVERNPNVPGNQRDVESAVLAAIGKRRREALKDIAVTSTIGRSATEDPNTMDTVRVKATYPCVMPFAKEILCSGSGRSLTYESRFPHQGARYIK